MCIITKKMERKQNKKKRGSGNTVQDITITYLSTVHFYHTFSDTNVLSVF